MDLEIPIGKRTRFYRLFEIIPGFSSVFMITLPIVLSFIDPFYGAVFVIIYIIFWFVKAIAMWVRSIQGYNTLQRASKVDWAKRLSDLENPKHSLIKLKQTDNGWGMQDHRRNLERLAMSAETRKPSDIYNAVIIPTYNESLEVLDPTIKLLQSCSYDSGRLIVIIAYEERGGETTKNPVLEIERRYKNSFHSIHLVMHPADIPDEVIGKGANITYAGNYLMNYAEREGISSDNIIVTTLDADNHPHEEYFSYVTYEYLVSSMPRNISLQPMSIYINNIWDVPAPMRILATANSIWNIVVSQRPHALRNFAAHSQGLSSLIDTAFWSKLTIVEDGHQFWRSYFRYNGHYNVVPIYVPIYQSVVLSETYKTTLKAQFIQIRRWAYGVSDIPYVAERVFTKKRTIPFWDGFWKFILLFEGHISWASAPYILMLGAFAPLLISPESSRSIAAQQLPGIASMIQTVALVGILINIVMFLRFLPKRPKKYTWFRSVTMITQWVLSPLVGIVYTSAAALNAQMHLLTGKYLTKFDVTDKVVVKHES
ncbi:hypothetical protein EOM57_00375 [Candidatus Saccharibacteria bacterium]|nr:hypothetical protein [Candidatus Saccharibacteria bacterium]